MSETDTSRNKLHRLIGYLSHDYACDMEREASDVIVALLARAEKAEATIEVALNEIECTLMSVRRARQSTTSPKRQSHALGKAEAVKDIRRILKGEPT